MVALVTILRQAGEAFTNEAVYNAFREREKSGKLTYARKDSRIESTSSIQKILALLARSREDGVYELLKDVQFTADGDATLLATWPVAVKLPSAYKSNEEFAWAAHALAEAIRGTGWDKLAADLTGSKALGKDGV